MNAMHKTGSLALWAAGLTVLTWSSSYAAISYGLRVFTPGELAFLRFLIATACFAVLMVFGLIKLPARRDWPAVVLLGLVGQVGYQLFLGYGMTHMSAGGAAVIISMVPAVTSVLAVLRLKESVGRRAMLGLGIAFAGTLLVTVGRGREVHLEPTALLIFGAVLCSSSYFVFQKPVLARSSALGFTAATLFVGALGMLPFATHLPQKLLHVSPAQLGSALYLALVPTVIGFFCWSFALARAPASQIASFLYLQPIGAFVIAWLWLGEVPTWLIVGGALLAIVGVLLATAPPALTRLLQRWMIGPRRANAAESNAIL